MEDISHVFNYDLPLNPEDYVHRIGRTARAGASGKAVSLACEDYVFGLEDIEAYIGHKIPVAWPGEDWFEPEPPEPKSRPKGRRTRKRGSARRNRGHAGNPEASGP